MGLTPPDICHIYHCGPPHDIDTYAQVMDVEDGGLNPCYMLVDYIIIQLSVRVGGDQKRFDPS